MVGNLVAKVEKFTGRERELGRDFRGTQRDATVPQVRVDLSREQLDTIVQQWHAMSPYKTVVLALYVGTHLIGEVMVGDTQLPDLSTVIGTSSC